VANDGELIFEEVTGQPENVAKLQADVLAVALAAMPDWVTFTDMEDAGVGGRCPWKRLGELEETGRLEIVGRVDGRYGRPIKAYKVVQDSPA
jgi:hypothetical protein